MNFKLLKKFFGKLFSIRDGEERETMGTCSGEGIASSCLNSLTLCFFLQAFTQWLSQTIQPKGYTVSDLRLDIQDGLKLIVFFETLSGKKVRQAYDRKPKNRISKISNLSVALNFLGEMGIANPGCAAEDIIDAESRGIKLILGLLWTLFRRYKMREATGETKCREEDAVLEWVKKTTEGYKGVDIVSFRTSFNDGKAFLALVHAYNKEDPEFDYDEVSQLPTEELLATAFEKAEKQLGVIKLLDVQELLSGNVDERAIALYTTLILSAFRAKEKMRALQNEVGDTQQALSLESKSKEEITKMNADLEIQAAQLRKNLEDEQEHSKSLDELCEEIKKEISGNKEEIERMKKELEELQAAYDALTAQNDEELADKLAAEAKDTEAKTAAQTSLHKEIEDLEKEHDRIRNELDSKKSETENTTSALKKRGKKAKDGIASLKIVHSNLDQHNEDLIHWQRYFDGQMSSAVSDEYILSLKDELEKITGDNVEERTVALLKERFAEETKEMAKLLEQRRDFEKDKNKKASKESKKN